MRAIILAAGYATRLYPLTKDKPKALLPVCGKPIIDYIIDKLQKVKEVKDITVISNHKFAEDFYKWAESVKSEKPVYVLDDGSTCEDDRLGAIGDIYFAVNKQNINEDVLIIAGDNLFTFELSDCNEFFKEVGENVVVVKEIDNIEQLRQFGVAVLNENGKVMELVEKPQNPPSNTAVFATYFYNKETVDLLRKYIEEGNKADAPGYFVQWLYKIKDVYAYKINGECFDVGNIEAYNEVQAVFA